ncbi:RAVE complex protein Rav1 C-terminal domain-containing protein [Plasmodiophora brassicae]
MTDWQWTEHPVSRTLSDPIVDIAFDPLADRIAVLSGVTITVWEVDPTAPSLRFVHSLESQSSYLRWADLGDCLLRLVSVDRASDTSLSVKMHMPNRDHVLRDHEFMSLRWQTIEARVDLPHPLLSGRQITALACSQSGTLLIAAGRYMVVVESMLSGDSITSIMPVPVYHPSLLTELLMTGHSEMVETIVSMVIDSVTEQNDMAPAIPLSVLLDSSISREHVSFSEKDLADLTEALTMRSIHLLTPPENLQLVVVARTLLRLKQDSADLDISGTRFMVAARLFEFERVAHQSRRVPQLDEVDIAWALHSSSQSALAHLCFPPSIPDWNAFQALGAGYWLTSVPELRRVVEFIAKNQFVEDRNPLRAMLWYMMLGKKSVFLALLKSSPGQRLMWDFFSRDFNDARWRSAAIKNAFEFVSTRKFWSAIALFILAESLQDAVAVCLRNMHDPQLALVICRLVGGADSPLIAQILKEDILPESVASHNQWMQHIVHWLCGQWEESIQCLTVVDDNASTFRPDVHSLLNAIGKEPPPVLECASGYAQRGWPFLAIVNLLKDRDRYTGHPFLLRFARSALSVRAASSKVLSEDIEGISRFVGLPAEVVRKPLELFQRSHRFFAVDGCLSDILRVMTRVFQSSDLDLAYRYRDSIRDACRAIRSSPTSYRASAALWTGAFLISRHDLALLVRLLRVRSDAMVEAFGEDRSETWSRPNDADPSPIESIVDSPYSDPEIVKVLQRLLECLCLSRMVEILVSKAMPPVDHESYDDVNGLISAMRALCHEMTVDLIHFVRDALDHCRVLTRSGVSLETVLAPLRSPAPLTSPLHHLFVSTDAQRVASCLATDIENVCSTGPFFRPVDIFRLPSELVVGVAFNRCDPSSLAVAVRKSIREINLESALRFRTRSRDSHELLEDELPSWEGCRHRFDSLEERSAAAYDEYMFPVPLLRAHLVLPDVPAALPSSVPVPLGERLFRSSPVYHRMTASVSEDSPLSSVTPDLACSSLIAHPALPVYVSSSQSSLYTWHFGKPRPIAENKVPVDFEGTVTSLRFDRPSLGSRIAVTESNGGAAVYSFDAGTMAPFQAWEAHDRCWTSEFVASPSVVATGGTSKNKTVSNVRLWDLLLPPRQSLVNGFTGRQRGQRGVAALSYVGRRQQLVAGNSAGHLDVFDLRGPPTQPVAHVDKAHHGRITALAFDDLHDAIISGDSDGCVRIWDASTLDLHAEFPALFDARRYFHASFGVTCVDVTASGHLICAGTNGTVKYIRRNDG